MLFNLQLSIVGIVHCIHDPFVVLVCRHNDKGDDIDTFFLNSSVYECKCYKITKIDNRRLKVALKQFCFLIEQIHITCFSCAWTKNYSYVYKFYV
jgi:hypothetical protein